MRVASAVSRHYDEVLETGQRFFDTRGPELAAACWGMARRFHAGGRLLVWGLPGAAFSDAQHVAVEFIHPVLVGKRALPAIAVRERAHLDLLAGPEDIRMEIHEGRMVVDGAAFDSGTSNAFVAQEVLETAYHELWELVHVFFEHEGLLAQGCTDGVCVTCGDVALPASVIRINGSAGIVRTAQGDEEADLTLVLPIRTGELVLVHGGVALERVKPIATFSQEFYPFLTNEAVDVPRVLADVQASVTMKWEEVAQLRRTMELNQIERVLELLRERVAAGAQVLVFGNGGSATDSADFAADLQTIGVRALDLAGEPSVLTAVGNDIGFDEIFARQVIALGRPGDVAVGISTSGRSGNVLRALHQARKQEMTTLALVGYGGGDMAKDDAIDHVLITDSTYIPRIQEAQATIYHALVRGLEEGMA